MEKRKSSVVKSNSTSEAKKNNSSAPENNKKSRSSAEFQAKITVTGGFQPLKRRGVYVEKKTIKIPIKINGVRSPDARVEPRVLSRRIRRPDKKRFLANVLTLLSKSTAGTQCSGPNSNEQLQIEKTKQRIKKQREEEIILDSHITSSTARRKTRYKSKHLKNHVNGEIDSLIILQSTKEIIQTPSNNSECITPLNRKAVSTHIEPQHMDWTAPYPPPDRQDLNITSSKASHTNRARLISSEEETGFEENRNDKNIYNFFVDILKSTLSVCDVTYDSDGRPLHTNTSNISLVIDEVVAEKLKIKDDESKAKIKENELKTPYNELYMAPCNSKCYYSIMPYETEEWGENFKPEFSKQYKVELSEQRKKQRIMSNSFQYRAKPINNRPRPVPKMPMYKTTSMPVPPPLKIPIKIKAKNKRDFIHSIKQELQFDREDVYEKPNFFQALKTIAKNKKKQSVNFRANRRPSDNNVCQLRSRKVLSTKPSSKKQPKNPERYQIAVARNTRQPSFSSYNRQAPITIYETSSEESIHSNYSLEVIGYQDKTEVKTHSKRRPPVMQKYSSPSSPVTVVALSECDYMGR